MGITSTAVSGGGIKTVQRGSAAGAGTVTITAVDITKSFVTVFGTASSGTVAASGAVASKTGNVASGSGSLTLRPYGGFVNHGSGGPAQNVGTLSTSSQALNFNAANLSGGSNNLVAAVVQGYLSDSTSLVVSGACRFEVVEFN